MHRSLLHKIVLFLFLGTCIMAKAQTTITSQVATGNDDAEERISDGNMDLGSSDLELTSDGGTNQLVGMRFRNINIPQGTTILSASIQFTTDETDSGSTSVTIRGEDIDNASIFSSTNSDISNRTLTTSSAAWNSIPAWNTVGQSGVNQQSPDLTSIVQQIINRGGWTSGNSMAFVINGSGERTAESYNGSASNAPILTIVANFTPAPLPALPVIVPNLNRGLPYVYFIADNRSELYSVAPDPTASPLPSPTIVNTTFGGTPITFDGEGGGYRSTDRLVYVFMGADPTTSSDMYSIDPITGIATLVKSNIVAGHVDGAEFYINNSTGEEVMVLLYQNGTSGGAHRIMAINPNANGSNPAWSPYSGYPITLSGARTRADGISWNPDTAEFYIQNDGNVDYYTVDITTGATTAAFTTSLSIDGEGITYAADGTNYIEDENNAGLGRTIFIVDTSTGDLIPAAQLGSTGDVESIMGNLGTRNDAGDAPSSYGYAAHLLPVLTSTPLSIYMGATYPDSEDPFVNFSTGFSDDNNGDDEDGVTSGGIDLSGQFLTVAQTKTIDVSTNGSGVLNAWIDFNRDGDFEDSGEQIALDVAPSGGNITLSVSVPALATPGTSYARFRFSSETGLASGNSEAADGEVEDYQIIIYNPTICPPGETLVETSSITNVYATSVISSNSVNNSTNAVGNDDTTLAKFNKDSDELVLEMGQLISTGDDTVVNGPNGDVFDVWISSSATGPWTQVGNNATLDFTYTSPIDWQYMRLRRGAGGDNFISYIDASKTIISSSCEPDIDGDAVPDQSDLDNDNDGIPDLDETAGNMPYGDEDGDGILNGADTTDNGNAGDSSTTNYSDANSDGVPDIYDRDLDGIPNHLDLDSDNDGIFDAVEAGHEQTHTNGIVNGVFGANGLANVVETSSESGIINYSISNTDGTDSDDYLDLDSDADGLPDNVEAQTTLGYIAPSGTVDANGVFTNYTSGLTPTNTDGTDNPDYLDLDSDNEGGSDTTESGITLAGVDTDGDGLDDATDATNGYSDPGGTIDNPLTAAVTLLDLDNDATTGGDVDFRDALDNRPDNDGDGIVDFDDHDDDNDGILDTDEGCGNLIINGNFEAQDFTDAITFPNGFTAANGTFIGSTYNTNTLYGWDYTQNIDGWVGGATSGANTFAEAYSRGQYLDIIGNNSASTPSGENNILSQTIPTIVGQSYTLRFYWGEDVGHGAGDTVEMDIWVRNAVSNAVIQSQNLTTKATGNVGGVIGPKNWFAFSLSFTATSLQTTIEFQSTPDGTSNGTALDYVSVFRDGPCQDTDNDGVIDSFDLDSDNDGIYDAVEAGHDQAHTNGEVNGTVGTDGVPDTVQATPNGELVNYTIADSDSDTTMDFREFDSDNDGCNDADEAYGFLGTDVDSNGKYGSGLPAVDSQGRVSAAAYPVPNDGNSNSVFDYQEATIAPTITDQPEDSAICPTDDTTFEVTASNANTYQWQLYNGTTWDDLSDAGIHSNTDAATLVITNASLTDTGNTYRVIVSNSAYICTELTSDEVTLTVAQPSVDAGLDQTICNGESATLTATPSGGSGSGYTYLWSTGATTQSIVVSPAGNSSSNVNVDYSVTVTDGNSCSNNDIVRVIVEPTPTISVSSAPSCNFILFQPNTYTVEVTVSSGTVTTTAGVVTNPSGNLWRIADVPDGTDIVVTVTDGNCSTDLPITAPNCACPTVNAPTNDGDQVYCQGSAIPELSASVGPGETVDWYAAASGGTALATGTTTYTPASAGTYFAEARSITFAGCTSATRTAIELIEETPSVANIGPDQTVFAGQNATITVTTANADTFQWQVSTDGGTIYVDIANGTEYTGVQTTTLTVNSVEIEKNGYRYRLSASLSGSSCGPVFSGGALLTVQVKTVITNRRITHRVKKN